MDILRDFVDLLDEGNIETLETLTKSSKEQCGRYDNITNSFSLLDRLDKVSLTTKASKMGIVTLELLDIDLGTPKTVSSNLLADRVATLKLDSQTPVHLRWVNGCLSLFILVDNALSFPVKSNVTTLDVNLKERSIWYARIGKHTRRNAVHGQSHLHGKVTVLERTLKVPYLCTYTLVDSALFIQETTDVPL